MKLPYIIGLVIAVGYILIYGIGNDDKFWDNVHQGYMDMQLILMSLFCILITKFIQSIKPILIAFGIKSHKYCKPIKYLFAAFFIFYTVRFAYHILQWGGWLGDIDDALNAVSKTFCFVLAVAVLTVCAAFVKWKRNKYEPS